MYMAPPVDWLLWARPGSDTAGYCTPRFTKHPAFPFLESGRAGQLSSFHTFIDIIKEIPVPLLWSLLIGSGFRVIGRTKEQKLCNNHQDLSPPRGFTAQACPQWRRGERTHCRSRTHAEFLLLRSSAPAADDTKTWDGLSCATTRYSYMLINRSGHRRLLELLEKELVAAKPKIGQISRID
jgi:hypothetical protein